MKRNRCTWLAATQLLLVITSSLDAQTITVDIAEDLVDVDPEAASVADLPGPDGHISFSEAMLASNHTPGRQTIGFAIPPSEWNYLDWYYPGRAVVHTIVGVYWGAYDEVTIDGRTQTAFSGDTNPDGWEVVLFGGGALYLNADNCTVTGLDSSTVSVHASGGVVENNSGPMGIELFGGTGSLVRGNTGGGYVQIDRSSDNVVVGNTFQRVRVLGWIGGGQPATNNRIGGPSLAERNFITGVGTWNSQGIPGGFALQLFDSSATRIENNWIGTTPDGLSQGHLATTAGILFEGENHDTVIRDNRIAGILGHAYPPHGPAYVVGSALQIYGTGSGVSLVGNTIGLNAEDEPVLGSVTGISTVDHYLGPVQDVVIGGSAAGEGNEIAGHLASGISVGRTFSGVRITGNSLHDNGGPGIDLIGAAFQVGVTPNDALDADSGGNELQNFPTIRSAVRAGNAVLVRGVLATEPLRAYAIDLYASPSLDPSGFGEGARFLGSTSVATDSQGRARFLASLARTAPAGWFVTATATDLERGSTSEFSAGKRLIRALAVH